VTIALRSVGNIVPVWADRVAVAVVADNLLSNALKFSSCRCVSDDAIS
jgi:signal transduction histidine kinase